MADTPPFELVWIEWADAASIDAWTDAEAMAAGVRKCLTTGWLMRETDREIYVSGTRSESDGCCTIIIPKCCITKRAVLPPPAATIDTENLRHG